ncbi:MAG: NUDIX hydrolase [Lachnospiraceae bacterium]|jgi:8-oxo-dGTP diphosphatase|nr:NUDIX hydrolase [Lachnospiraceae bacterium]
MTELWDAYDNKFNRIKDMTLVRGEPLPAGVYHLVCDIIVKHRDGSYLLMQRDLRKHYGGMWELTAGGSALQGEAPLDCAARELKEETGLTAVNLEEIGRGVHDMHHALYVEYLCVTDCDKQAVLLQEGETIGYKWVDRDTLFTMGTRKLISDRTMELVRELNI